MKGLPKVATTEYLDKLTPSVGPGPFYGHSMFPAGIGNAVDIDAPGALRLRGRVLDGSGRPVSAPDILIEFLQADQFARSRSDDNGNFEALLEKPATAGKTPFFHVRLWVFPLTEPLDTRMYFPDEQDANAEDEVLLALDETDRTTLIATATADGLEWDIHLSGDSQTAFLIPEGEASIADSGVVKVRHYGVEGAA